MRCTGGGGAAQSLDSSGFSSPVPWVGLYVAAASIICALAMSYDAISAIRHSKLWFPSSIFSLNATTLTILSVATKLPLDLSSPMPSRPDQLAKLSGSALVATAAANLLPSLASAPDASSAISNIIALAILVVTIAANVCIQIATGVIYTFVAEHLAVLVLTLVLLLVLCSSALAVPTTKQLLEKQFDDKFGLARDQNDGNNLDIASLRESVKGYWLMAHTSNPQYVLGRSATCTASGVIGLLTCLILAEAAVRSVAKHHRHGMNFCSGTSDYKWSTTVVFFSQAVAVVVGTVAPSLRWFNAVSSRRPFHGRLSCRDELRAESYWTLGLTEWKEDASFTFRFVGSQWSRKTANELKNLLLNLLAKAQVSVVVACKLIRLASLLLISWIPRRCSRWSSTAGSSRTTSSLTNLSSFVLRLEGEEELVNLMIQSEREDTDRWIWKGTKKKPAHLIKLMSYATLSPVYQGVCEFDSRSIPSLVLDEPPNIWAMPLVTLTTIAIILPYIEPNLVESLRRGVREGLQYVRLVDKHLDGRGLHKARKAADVLWIGIDLYDKWLDNNLKQLMAEENSGKQIIEKLEEISRRCVTSFQQTITEVRRNLPEWPAELWASNCMYRVTSTILQEYDVKYGTDDRLFLWLRATISDILRACLTNLPKVINIECICTSSEEREKKVRDAAFLLGETKRIIEILGNQELICSYPEDKTYIENWCETR
ncbi:hypothetical protein Cni_G26036 [Canna indica]|uniref:Uncharacterized protein n=1 Tax=Canna indica TaxID=4628 RepID=A0AAQ3KY78_9LILI|nr:hypothetical protein Cni_G26036 [Canna indica]